MGAVQRRLGRPGLAGSLEHRGGGVVGAQPRVVRVPAGAQLAAVQGEERAGEGDHRRLARALGAARGGVEVGLGVGQPTQVELHVPAVVQGGGETGLQPNGFVEEGQRGEAVALLVQHDAQGVPEPGLMGMVQDRRPQRRHRLLIAVQVGQRAPAPVQRLQPRGLDGQHLLPERQGLRRHVRPPGQPRQAAQQLHIAGI